MNRCGSCGAEAQDDQRFCGACGAALTKACPACGRENPPAFRFCGECGAALAGAPARETEERRWVSVLFADLSGFTALSERMDPEDVRTFVDTCMRRMAEIVEDFGGTVSSVHGDELMALFGAPVAHDDDPERAVRAALGLLHCAEENAAEFGELPLRVGVNTGEVMFAPVGPGAAREHTVMGDVVNTAARLQTGASRGSILVGEETYRATRGAIRYRAADPVVAKGKDQPVRAWTPVETVATATDRPVSGVPLAGRDAELRTLLDVWGRTVAGARPHLVTVVGDPGLGKTRLAREFLSRIEARVVRGRCLPYGDSAGFGAFAQQVRHIAGIAEADPPDVARSKLDAAAGDGDIATHLGVLVGLGEAAAVADRHALFLSARRFVESLGPTVLLFEDTHWADASLIELIEMLAGRTRDCAVLFLALTRPDATMPHAAAEATTIVLEPLRQMDARAMASQLLPSDVDEDLLVRMTNAAGGNPLFIEELAAAFSERREHGELPSTIKGIIAARIDALPPDQRRALLDASVVGQVFWRGALGNADVAALDGLEARDLVRLQPSPSIAGEDEYAFKHALIRDAAYATLSRAARRERHASVARFLESRSGEFASMLAHHWLEAGDTTAAARYLLVAAEHARNTWAVGEAVKLYRRAEDMIEDDESRRSAQLLRAVAMLNTGEVKPSADLLDELLPHVVGRERSEALYWRGRAAYWLADAPGVHSFADALAQHGDALGDDAFRAAGDSLRSAGAGMDGDIVAAIDIGRRALDAWPTDAPQAERSILLGSVGICHYWRGEYDAAAELCRQGMQLGMESHSVEGFLGCAPELALALAGLGRHEEAIELCVWVIERGTELELEPRWTSRAMNMYAGVLYEIGQNDEGRRLGDGAIELASRAGFTAAVMQARIDALFDDVARGDAESARAAWPAIWEGASALKGWHEWLLAGRLHAARAQIELGLGRTEPAAEAARTAIESAVRYGRPKYELLSRLTLASALRDDGEARRALAIARTLGHPPSIWRAATVVADLGDDADAAAEAQSVLTSFAASLSPGRRAALLAATAQA